MPIKYFDIKNGIISFSQKDYSLARHRHFPIEVAFAISGQLHIRTDNQQYTNVQSVIINSNVPHIFNCENSECQLYFIDPTSNAGIQLSKYFLPKGEDIVVNTITSIEIFKEKYIYGLDEDYPFCERDDRVKSCLSWIDDNYSKEGIKLSMISENVFLSESRIAHLFKKQIGISIHQYILWKKIESAIKRYIEGASLTECAYSFGFSDSSHFNKTFQKMFGIYPSFSNQE
ncbi:AraC family transcriptional regulator [Arenibacter sp. M-2]|uniref:AraC family transcriptional regulator n=1 Tax=Arenibacter sp. M-2 TaxID=3053612 RepID=UPI002570A6C2|nr:AraC family transcriptional regulator [Arenibacter sp. M-2]MDL5514902.1 AraC family transcriptional regulator [Arenibacter sp. M-2]